MHSDPWVVFGTTYSAVLAAEILGDKLLYTTGVLSARFRAIPVACGVSAAFAAKMAIAVALGQWIAHLPRWVMVVAAATTFGGLAIALLRMHQPARREPRLRNERGRGLLLSFATVLLSEWGDPGQLITAALSARFGSPIVVWFAAVCAMASKGAVAAFCGARIRRFMRDRIPPAVVRYSSAAVVIVLGILSVVETMPQIR